MDIAIVGVACKFPGSEDQFEFWNNLIGNCSMVSEVPENRWDWKQFWGDPATETNKTNSRWGGFIRDVDAFDHQFFGLLPHVVEAMDPQQRIMLELTWTCLEDAGIAPSTLQGKKVGMVVSTFNHDYKEMQERGHQSIEAHHSTGNAGSIIVNRISHFFDFKGPSLAIDTACSGALNAIHCAIQALQFDDCELALAGGINLILTPTRHISFSKMGMMSPTGTCRTFDDSANGYVRSEGAGVIVLKPLARAQKDQDQIYGIIRGTAVNHCGDTYTLTYPSPDAQADVIIAAHHRAGVPVNTVNYVEAHGTGTPKGDPIEFRGLCKAFGQLADSQNIELPEQSCWLGSVKANIGHLEAAAGIAGVIKVLMAMRHQMLPALVHFQQLNQRISLAQTPFAMLAQNQPWLPINDEHGTPLPLRAGVSSFGFGGTNAHVVLEQYLAPRASGRRQAVRMLPGWPVCLSAKTETALSALKQTLYRWIEQQQDQCSLADVSYTLTVGRDHFEYRDAAVVRSVEELLAFLQQPIEQPNVESADASVTDQLPGVFSARKKPSDPQLLQALNKLVTRYLQGSTLDWQPVFAKTPARRISLPGYRFARTRVWLKQQALVPADEQRTLHPLLHENISDFDCQAFQSVFTGTEFFLDHHQVAGRKILPAAAYMELVRAGLEQSLGGNLPATSRIELRDINWLRPFDSASVSVLRLHLYPLETRTNVVELEFEVTGGDGNLYCRGIALPVARTETTITPIAQIADEQATFDAQQTYQLLTQSGLNYGPGHRAIESVTLSQSSALATVVLPDHLAVDPYYLHPGMLDCALQVAVLLAQLNDYGVETLQQALVQPIELTVALPFLLNTLKIHEPLARHASVSVNQVERSGALKTFDIRMFNHQPDGTAGLAVELLGMTLNGGMKTVNVQRDHEVVQDSDVDVQLERLADISSDNREGYYVPQWVPADTTANRADLNGKHALLLVDGAASDHPHLIATLTQAGLNCLTVTFADGYEAISTTEYRLGAASTDDAKALIQQLKAQGIKPEFVIHLPANPNNVVLTQTVDHGIRSIFVLVQALIPLSRKLRLVSWVASETPFMQPALQGLSGFYKTLSIEKPGYSGVVVQAASIDVDDLMVELASQDRQTDIVYQQGQRWGRAFNDLRSGLTANATQQLSGLPIPSGSARTDFRHKGVYLITGGMGALGIIFGRHLAQHYQATVCLTGRAPLDADKQQQLNDISASGGQAIYLQCDVNRLDDVEQVMAQIRTDHGAIHGILHAAGVIEDSFIIRKQQDAFDRVIGPKVYGTANLDQASAEDELDCFILFSSVTGVLGNIGQCDYGYGNSFEDYFSLSRNLQHQRGERSGRTLSVNWPYWKDGGMTLSDEEEAMLRKSFGIIPLLTHDGIAALETALRLPVYQVGVLPGDSDKVRSVLGCVTEQTTLSAKLPATADQRGISADELPDYLAQLFTGALNVDADRFRANGTFQDYGFDSVVMLNLVNLMEKTFAGLPKTLFFECQTMAELVEFLLENYRDSLDQLNIGESPDANKPVAHAVNHSVARISERKRRAKLSGVVGAPPKHIPIAIIGLAGRYPQADTLETFWQNLVAGKDCIEEIPAQRWDLTQVFRPGEPVQGKSYSKWGGFLTQVDQFDPLYFNISPSEAEKMDPQERLFLEVVAHAVEDAGYHPDQLCAGSDEKAGDVKDNPVGVYAGCMWGDYQLHGVESDRPQDWVTPHSFYWSVANRISYFFNLSGPSITLDTACSSSLTAVHLACSALAAGDIRVAIAGGVNLSLHANKYNLLSDMHFLSSDGRCRSFGEGGDGYVPAEGVGAVILKPLADAERDGDHIYGVIRSTAVNHGGRTSGFTVPNPKRQAALMQEAFERGGIDPRHISYLEAHGTGTSLGDPIEINGLVRAFGSTEKQFCAIGSVKSNIGHAEAAAGVAGITKVLLQMQHQMLVPSLHSQQPNPHIDMAATPFVVQQQLQPWERPVIDGQQQLRLAGISSFGAGGANGHVIIEEYASAVPATPVSAPALIVQSARKQEALLEMAAQLKNFLQRNPDINLHDLAYTLQTGRLEHDWRLAVEAESVTMLMNRLERFVEQPQSVTDGIWFGRIDKNHRDAFQPDPQLRLPGQQNRSLAEFWLKGGHIPWKTLYDLPRRKVSAPGYAYQRQRYWIEKPVTDSRPTGLHAVLDNNCSSFAEVRFQKTLHGHEFYLQDHVIAENPVLPGVVLLEMANQAGQRALPDQPLHALYDIQWLRPVVVAAEPVDVRIVVTADEYGLGFEIFSQQGEQSLLCCRGGYGFMPVASEARERLQAQLDLAVLSAESVPVASLRNEMQSLSLTRVNDYFAALGFQLGERFKPFRQLHFNATGALAELTLPAAVADTREDYQLHPAIMDAVLRTSLLIGGDAYQPAGIPVPVSMGRLQLLAPLPAQLLVWVTARSEDRKDIQQSYDIHICDVDGNRVAFIEEFVTQAVAGLFAAAKATTAKPLPSKPVIQTAPAPTEAGPATSPATTVLPATENFLSELIAAQTRIPRADLQPDDALESFGINSVMVLAIHAQIAEVFGDEVPKTLFYEHQTIREVTEYLLENFPQAAAQLAGSTLTASSSATPLETMEPEVSGGPASSDRLNTAARSYLRDQVAGVTKVTRADIDFDASLEQYGVNSVMVLALNEKLVTVFGEDVSKTLFYEYPSIAALAEYLVEYHADDVQVRLLTQGPLIESTTAVGTNESAATIEEPDISDAVSSHTDLNPADELFQYLAALIAEVSGHEVQRETLLSALALDEIQLQRMTSRIQDDHGLTARLWFYECHTLADLVQALLDLKAGQPQTVINAPVPATSKTMSEMAVHPHRKLAAALVEPVRRAARNQYADDDIAIIGLSGRYPLADNLEQFWSNLYQGRDCIREVPTERWNHALYYHADRHHKGSVYSKWGGFMDQVDQFDAQFFGMTRRESEIIDPQERLFLETAWQCLEDSAYTRDTLLHHTVGVFVGVMWGHYELLQVSEAQQQLGKPTASFSSIANRVSYCFDFHGPSMALDSMCSSSLSAIHLACQSIRSGDCDYALAGGVNVAPHPTKYQQLCQQQFLSDDGRCRAFGEGGNGYVPGEGVGAVLLKSAAQAIAEGDHIYAIIKASALNHGGKTSGFTVPNQRQQANVIAQALARSGWQPGSISYVEAHGTGTALGDPIELSGLNKAYGLNDGSGPGCALGSVKSNIGHLESAAGIAGITKILLQMQHGMIVPSLHSSALNPNLPLTDSRFYVPQQPQSWLPAPSATTLRAGISSFGAGGANAHILLEHYSDPELMVSTVAGDQLFVLSADSHERLQGYVETLSPWLHSQVEKTSGAAARTHFINLCYSAMVGREQRDERLAVIARDHKDLAGKLDSWLTHGQAEQVYHGSSRGKEQQLNHILDATTRSALLTSLLQRREIHTLAKTWVASLNIDWPACYPAVLGVSGSALLRRISFPSQPLQRQRYWVQQAQADSQPVMMGLHPLLDRNISTIVNQRFEKYLTGDEFYLRDHQVENQGPQPILPGVAYLEMARAAAQLSVPEEYVVSRLRHVMWLRPIQFTGKPEHIRIDLSRNGDNMAFSVCNHEQAQCSTGDVLFSHQTVTAEDQWLDIKALQNSGGLREEKAEIYSIFEQMGFYYGPAYQCTQWRIRHQNSALVKLQLPEDLADSAGAYFLHPSLMDAALRSCLGLGDAHYTSPMVPFSLEEIELRHPLTTECYVYVMLSGESSRDINKYNLVITDKDGKILVKIQHVSARHFHNQTPAANADRAIAQLPRASVYQYCWQPLSLSQQADKNGTVLLLRSAADDTPKPVFSDRWQVVEISQGETFRSVSQHAYELDFGQPDQLAQLLSELAASDRLPDAIINLLDVSHDDIDVLNVPQHLQLSVHLLYRWFIALHRHDPERAVRIMDVNARSEQLSGSYHDALSGFAASMTAVNHRIQIATLTAQSSDIKNLPLEALLTTTDKINARQYRLNEQGRFEYRALVPATLQDTDKPLLPPRSTCLITGGVGKLGLIMAHYLIANCQPNLVLVSRHSLTAEQQQQLAEMNHELAGYGSDSSVVHMVADMAERESVEAMIDQCRQQFGALHAVIHAAGSASDTSVLDLNQRQFDASLSAKIHGLVYLDHATRNDALAWFVNFSSISAHVGDLGSGSYGAGNRFMDAYSIHRPNMLSINWPLWAEGGLAISDSDAGMLNFSGMTAMPERVGLDIFNRALNSGLHQLFVAYGDTHRIEQVLGVSTGPTVQPSAATEKENVL
ncbi:SDR family NAD(P)-dependent oxidoreductase [Gynuella sunshinyii]|uniref:SDR family NAD(P)-dependent oxidoreductase n=1 Tax=Gynuella sunshinyii TaxID=1445505 RepID=UPI00069A96FB|nr:SDR family NAD(P)-dependent oxidoreductase [Gynuella sunshinyii]